MLAKCNSWFRIFRVMKALNNRGVMVTQLYLANASKSAVIKYSSTQCQVRTISAFHKVFATSSISKGKIYLTENDLSDLCRYSFVLRQTKLSKRRLEREREWQATDLLFIGMKRQARVKVPATHQWLLTPLAPLAFCYCSRRRPVSP